MSPFDQILNKKSPEFDHIGPKSKKKDTVRGRNGCMQPLSDSERRRGYIHPYLQDDNHKLCAYICRVRACMYVYMHVYTYILTRVNDMTNSKIPTAAKLRKAPSKRMPCMYACMCECEAVCVCVCVCVCLSRRNTLSV